MKILVLSDTHIPLSAKTLPARILKEAEKADLLLHAGDFVSLDILKNLQSLCSVRAVYGNMDSLEIRQILPEKDLITVNKFKIALIHGWGPPDNLISWAKERFKNDNPDVVVFGHSHHPENIKFDKTLYFNPGSPTDRMFSPYNSFGIIEIEDKIKTKIIRI